MNTLTRDDLSAFCKPRGISPKKDTEKAKAWRIPPVDIGERKPAQFVMKHIVPAEGPSNATQYEEGGTFYGTQRPTVELYTLHPTPGGAAMFEHNEGYAWEPNPPAVRAAFRALLEELNPVRMEGAA